jgi:SAM-dependent methyltransferase
MTGSTLDTMDRARVDDAAGASEPLDPARVEAFAGRLFELYTGGLLTFLVDIGHRTGLFAAAAAGPATSAELAGRADLQERYVREWLGAMVTGGILEHDPAAGTYRLPAEHAACLTGPGSANLAPLSRLDTHLAKHVDAVARAFREGGGVPYAEYRPEFTDVMDAIGRGAFDAVHDQVAPAAVLERIHAALAPGGTFVMVEPRTSSDLAGNLGNPVAPLLYSVSTLHCLTVSLAGGGAGLGAAWGEELARSMLADAGFVDVAVHEAPGDPLNAVFVATRPAA